MSGGTSQTALLHHLGNSCKTIEVLCEEMGLSRKQISYAASALIGKEYLERVERGCFQLTDAGRIAVERGEQITSGPRGQLRSLRRAASDTLRQRAWNVMRIQRRFSIPDLLTAATTGTEIRAGDNLQHYCKALSDAGILRRLPARQRGTALTSNGFAQYTLVQDLGHIAPVHRKKARLVIDHNSGKEMAL